MSEDPSAKENQVASKIVLEMIAVANDFCSSMEQADRHARKDLLTYLQRILPLIYIRASLLPDLVAQDEDAIEHYVTEEQWENLFNQLREKFGEEDLYYFINLSEKSNQDAIRGSLSENLADIYQDLKDFLLLYQKPLVTFRENAVMDCKRLFETRFGSRIVNALTAIHAILYGNLEPPVDSQADLF
jgi:hypothetical protein